MLDGKPLEPSTTVGELKLEESSTLKLSPSRSTTPTDGCKVAAQPIVGDCGFCQKRFCGKHRMLESHQCEGLEDARKADKDRNTAKLEGERTVMLRGL